MEHMQKKVRIKLGKFHFIGIGVLVLIAVGAFAVSSIPTVPGELDEFAQCITDQGAIFYGAFWCPHCADQKSRFADSVSYVNYIECSTPDRQSQTPACTRAGIQSYPTWEFSDGSRINGVVALDTLAQKTGCQLPA